MKDPNAKEGMRIRMVSMVDDPNPIASGEEGTIRLIDGMGYIHVQWDNGRLLGVIPGVDQYELVEPDHTEIFKDLNETGSGSSEIKIAIKKTPTVVKKSMPSMSAVKSTKTNQSFKGIKDVKVETEKEIKIKKNPKDKKVKTEMTSTAGGVSTGAYTGNAFASGGVLTKKNGVAKPGPLHSIKRKKRKKNIFTKSQLFKEITNMEDTGIDDTSKEAWADKNKDGWRWNDTPIFENGEIVDDLAKIKTSWDDETLDISKEWDKTQNLKKEDLLRLIKNRINEAKKGVTIDLEKGDEILTGKFKNHKEKVKSIGKDEKNQPTVNKKPMLKFRIPKLNKKEKESVDETTTWGSVWGVNGRTARPRFAAKKGEWKMVKKPAWEGGTILQTDESDNVLNPVNEINDVKYNPQGKIVKIKKKCTKFPYCSQGAIDKPLNISKTNKGSGSYVEDFMKNIHEVAKELGKTFDEVYHTVKNNI